MTRSDSETLLAISQLIYGDFTLAQCLRRIRWAENLPDFLCQNARSWKMPPARSLCECGNELKNRFGPCDQCVEEHAAIYHPNGKRRVFGLSENESFRTATE
jgi:hypothetical protein